MSFNRERRHKEPPHADGQNDVYKYSIDEQQGEDTSESSDEVVKKESKRSKSKRGAQQQEDEIVTLNVGGCLYTTTKDTLVKGDHMLSRMFSGKYKLKCLDGHPFIDRDGKHFRYILNYLRSSRLVVPKDRMLLEELLVEADYYGMKDLSAQIHRLLDQERKVQYCKVLCTGDWIAQLNYLVENKGWEIFKFIMETESKYRELDDYGNPLKQGIGWYDVQTQCILLKKPVEVNPPN